MVIMFFSSSLLNNIVFAYSIPMTIAIIFRSSSLCISMLLSYLILKKKFSKLKILSVVLVSLGIILSTAMTPSRSNNSRDSLQPSSQFFIGILLLSTTVLISSFLGLYQQHVYSIHGSHWKESLLYTHILSLPFFLLFKSDISRALVNLSDPGLPTTLLLGNNIPTIYLSLALNSLTQVVCISAVHKLSSFSTSVTLNLVLSIRKFISLIISVIVFKNPFSGIQWAGSLLVVVGTLLYVRPETQITSIKTDTKKKKE